MAPTIKWLRFESAAYDWTDATATGPLKQIEAEIDAWITAVNANASNTGRQLARVRGIDDSTTANYAGFVVRASANNNTENAWMHFGTIGSSTTRVHYVGSTYADDTSRGGYGTVAGNGGSDTSVTWKSNGTTADFLLGYDTTDGQEYLVLGYATNTTPSTAYEDGLLIYKTTTGEWAMGASDGASYSCIGYFNDSTGVGWDSPRRTNTQESSTVGATSSVCRGRFFLCSGSTSGPSLIDVGHGALAAANPDLLEAHTTSTYYFTGYRMKLDDLDATGLVYLLNMFYYGPMILVDLRP